MDEETVQMTGEELHPFMSGVTLAGKREPNGTIRPYGHSEGISNWPAEVKVGPTVFTLEQVVVFKGGWENAEYV